MAAKRLNHLDTLKFFAIVWVYTVHLIDQYCPELLDLWTQTPTAYLLKGISGKACVALFCLLLGYFAFAAGKAKKYSPLTYSVRRYLYFFVCALFIKGLYWFSARLGYFPAGLKERPGFVQTLLSSLFLDGGIYLAFWCIAPFLLGSVLAYIGGYFNLGIKELIPIVLSLMLVGQI